MGQNGNKLALKKRFVPGHLAITASPSVKAISYTVTVITSSFGDSGELAVLDTFFADFGDLGVAAPFLDTPLGMIASQYALNYQPIKEEEKFN